jgi:RNA polymerase sigma-70 factor (ECF subfamily)
MECTDEELFAKIKSGDRRGLEQLYERREPGLFRYALHVSGNHAIAEEATHEAFLALIQPNVRFDPGRGSLEGYLYGMVRNLVRNMLRNQPAESSHEPVATGSVLQSLIGDERASALHRAIRELPEAYRDTVILCDLEERSYEDAARAMECPVGTVRSRLHRARSLLAAKLTPGKAAAEMAAR